MSLTRSAKANGFTFMPTKARPRGSGSTGPGSKRHSRNPRIDSTAATLVIEHLARIPADNVEIELDFSDRRWEAIFQDIIRRSATLRYVTAVSAFTCSKMRPDGFGGLAVLITADTVMGKSTSDIVADFLNAAVPGRAHEPAKPRGQ